MADGGALSMTVGMVEEGGAGGGAAILFPFRSFRVC